jgi:hypothetical protein
MGTVATRALNILKIMGLLKAKFGNRLARKM